MRERRHGWAVAKRWLIGPAMFGAMAAWLIGCGGSVDSSEMVSLDELPWYTLVEEARFGSTEDPDQGFGVIGHVALHASGNLYVSDRLERQIRVFDSEAVHLRNLGGRGEGPGEFSTLSRFGLAGDTLWAIDEALGRVTLLGLNGEIFGTARFTPTVLPSSSPSVTVRVVPTHRRSDGLFVGDPRFARAPASEVPADLSQVFHYPYPILNPDGSIADTLILNSRELSQIFPVPMTVRGQNVLPPRMPPHEPLVMVGATWVDVVERPIAADAHGATFRISRLSHSGADTTFSRTYAYNPKPYGQERLDSLTGNAVRGFVAAVVRDEGSGADVAAARATVVAALQAAMTVPPFQPPIAAGHLAEDGEIWLQREEEPVSSHEWVRVGADGTLLGRFRLSRGSTILWTHAERIWVSEVDAIGFPWVVQYRLVSQ